MSKSRSSADIELRKSHRRYVRLQNGTVSYTLALFMCGDLSNGWPAQLIKHLALSNYLEVSSACMPADLFDNEAVLQFTTFPFHWLAGCSMCAILQAPSTRSSVESFRYAAKCKDIELVNLALCLEPL
ncbi:hypothetical protein MRB53_037242 [Persea americana]|nr:hypothetical protein MRB53_037242 [Persea americana]